MQKFRVSVYYPDHEGFTTMKIHRIEASKDTTVCELIKHVKDELDKKGEEVWSPESAEFGYYVKGCMSYTPFDGSKDESVVRLETSAYYMRFV